jgi:hypothetical protein
MPLSFKVLDILQYIYVCECKGRKNREITGNSRFFQDMFCLFR